GRRGRPGRTLPAAPSRETAPSPSPGRSRRKALAENVSDFLGADALDAEELRLAHGLHDEHSEAVDGRALRRPGRADRGRLLAVAPVDAVEDERARLEERRRDRRWVVVAPPDRVPVDLQAAPLCRAP